MWLWTTRYGTQLPAILVGSEVMAICVTAVRSVDICDWGSDEEENAADRTTDLLTTPVCLLASFVPHPLPLPV